MCAFILDIHKVFKHWINKVPKMIHMKKLSQQQPSRTIIKALSHTDLNHSLSFQRLLWVSDIKGLVLRCVQTLNFYAFHYMKENSPPNPYFSLSSRHWITWKDSKSQTFIFTSSFAFLWFQAHTECVYSTKACVFTVWGLLSHPLVNVAFASSQHLAHHPGKMTRDDSHLSHPEGFTCTIVTLTSY